MTHIRKIQTEQAAKARKREEAGEPDKPADTGEPAPTEAIAAAATF